MFSEGLYSSVAEIVRYIRHFLESEMKFIRSKGRYDGCGDADQKGLNRWRDELRQWNGLSAFLPGESTPPEPEGLASL
jgi:hypothetical protein